MRRPRRPAAGARTALSLLLVGAGGHGAPVAAQEPAPADTARAAERPDTLPGARDVRPLEPLTVTVTRTEASLLRVPFAVQALGEEVFRAGQRGISLEESLRAVPGVTVHDRRNFALGDRISVRGAGARSQFGVRGVRVLLDGIPLTMPDGQTALTNLDPASVGRAEVVRGPAAALYGNAAGGVLAFRTRGPPGAPVAGGPRVLVGSHGLLEARTEAGGTAGELGWTLTASRLETDGFREHARAEIWRTNATLRTRPAPGTSVTGLFHLYHTPFAENPSSLALEDATERPRTARPFVVAQGAGESATQGQAGIAAETELAASLQLRGAAWGVKRNLWNPIPDRIIDLDRLAGGARAELGSAGPEGDARLRWTVGLEVERQSDRRRESGNLGVPEGADRALEGERLLDQRETVLGVGPFAQVELRPASRWAVTLAGRWDHFRFAADDRLLADGDDGGSRTMARASPALGVVFLATQGLSAYANLSTAFQTPTMSELSNRPDGAGGFDPDLDPERTLSLELGLKGALASPGVALDLALYRARVTDALIPFEGPTEETFFRNAGRIDRTGLEAGLGWRAVRPLDLRLAYAWQRFRFDEFSTEEGDFSGQAEPGVPGHALLVSAVGRGPGGLRSGVDLRWTDAFAVDDANAAWNPSYRVVDLRFSLEPPAGGGLAGAGLSPFLGVNNLFGERYNGSVVPNAFAGRYYEPAPGFELYGGLSLSLGGRARGR